MKKFLLLLVALFTMGLTTNAQQTTVEGSRFFDNTYIGVSVGPQTGMYDLSRSHDFTYPTGSVYVGKWITPIFGLEVNGDVLFHDFFSTRNTFVDATYVGMNARFNLNNIFHRYKGQPDLVEVIPFVGFGWLHAYGSGVYDWHYDHNTPTLWSIGRNSFATKMGIDVAIHLDQQRSWSLNVRPTVEYALTGGVVQGNFPRYNVHNARLGLEIGFTYQFGHKNSKGVTTHNFTKAYTVKEYEDMVAQLSNVKPDTLILDQIVEVEVIKEVPVEVTKQSYVLTAPYFSRAKYNLDPTSTVMIDILAEEINNNKCPYTITGYASLEGDEIYNQELSLHRAESVRDALVSRGVDPDRLTVVGGGPTNKFGSSYELNRTVVVEHTNCCEK